MFPAPCHAIAPHNSMLASDLLDVASPTASRAGFLRTIPLHTRSWVHRAGMGMPSCIH